ncbi:MAG: cell division protein ZapA [Lachnospiraceae bacterium]|jgi:cell division protein ZapA|nr:cell division protein ZapA [Lachnospiraceae bacterium]MDE7058364.1 cell division protein ZapA [Lachnospiraceae bacterium]
MAKKNTAEVLINGKVYNISGYESTAYLQRVASYLNEIEDQISQLEGYQMFSADEKQLLKNMNLADAYFKANDRKEELLEEVEYKDKEIYSLKHDLIDAKIEKDKLLAEIEELKGQLLEEQKKQVRLMGAASGRKLYRPEERL